MFLQELDEIGVPDCDMLSNEKLNKKLAYQQKILVGLRARFRTEYLGQLALTNKKNEKRELNIGDIVLIGDDNKKRIDWPLARIKSLVRGRDGKSRVFLLKTQNGELRRAIQRLYPLEISVKDSIDSKSLLREKIVSNNDKDKLNECKKVKDCKLVKKFVKIPKIVTTKRGRVIKPPQKLSS